MCRDRDGECYTSINFFEAIKEHVGVSGPLLAHLPKDYPTGEDAEDEKPRGEEEGTVSHLDLLFFFFYYS